MPAYDPDSIYNTTVADIGLQEGYEEASFNEAEANLVANVGYGESERERAEPGVFRSNSNRANRGGILTSGISGARRDTIAANFSARRAQNQLTLTQGKDRITRERQGGKLKRERETHGAQEKNAQEKDQQARETAAATAEAKREEERHREAQGLPPVQTTPEVSGTTPQPTTGGAKPRVKGKYVKGGKVVPATTPGAIYQAWE